jgi:hypothetical protein
MAERIKASKNMTIGFVKLIITMFSGFQLVSGGH